MILVTLIFSICLYYFRTIHCWIFISYFSKLRYFQWNFDKHPVRGYTSWCEPFQMFAIHTFRSKTYWLLCYYFCSPHNHLFLKTSAFSSGHSWKLRCYWNICYSGQLFYRKVAMPKIKWSTYNFKMIIHYWTFFHFNFAHLFVCVFVLSHTNNVVFHFNPK